MQASIRTIATFSLWLALVGSLVEILLVYLKRVQQPLMVLSPDYAWMAPVALLMVVAVIVVILSLVWRLTRHRLAERAIVFIPATLVTLNLLMLVPGLAHYAAALLAAGIAMQITRAVFPRPDAVTRLVRRSIWPVGLALSIAIALVYGALVPNLEQPDGAVPAPAGAPNLVLITLDTVRAGHLDVYGYGRQTMPRLAELAERGVVFEQALSTAPWTLPSHASMLTGRWPHELSTDYETPLDRTYPTLAEYLGDHGYVTAGFAANLKYVGAATGLSRGFDAYEDYSRSIGQMASSSTLLRSVANNFRLRRLISNDQHMDRVPAEVINARALAWIATQTRRPFFAFLNYFDAHEPYLPPAPYDRRFGDGRSDGRHSPLHHWLWNPAVGHRPLSEAEKREEIDAYDGALAWLDAQVGRFLDDLGERGLLDHTVVVVTSDHGEEFGEHGVYEHGYSLYAPGLHVPLIVVAPGRAPEAARIATPVSLRDLATTVVDLLGLADGAPFPGTSLAEFWRGDAPGAPAGLTTSPLLSDVSPSPGQPEWFPSSKGRMWALVHEGVKYIRNGDGREELYDAVNDPGEQRDLAGRPEWQASLVEARAALERLIAGQ